MDYGQPVKSDDEANAKAQIFETKGNIHTDNWDVSPDRNPRGIGNTAMDSPEVSQTPDEISPDHQETDKAINPALMPPDYVLNDAPVNAEQKSSSVIPAKDIKTTEGAIKAVDMAINELNDGNSANFYDEIRGKEGLVFKNLNNSFGRKPGEGQ